MRAELRPSSLGEILDRTAQMYRSHFLLYFGIAAVCYSGILLVSLIANTAMLLHYHGNALHLSQAAVAVSVLIGLISILPIAVAMAAVIRAVAANYLWQTTTIRDAYASVGRKWYRYILILLATYCYAMLPAVLLAGLLAAAIGLTTSGFGRNLFIGTMILLVMAAFVVAFLWMLRWLLAVAASLMEDLPVHRALKRSAVLTKGSRGRIFVMLLLVAVVMMVIQYAVQIPMLFLLWKSHGAPTLLTQVVASCGAFLSGSFVLPIYSIAITLFYYDQRIRKEGYDVEWLMEQAAMPDVANMATPEVFSGPITSPSQDGPAI